MNKDQNGNSDLERHPYEDGVESPKELGVNPQPVEPDIRNPESPKVPAEVPGKPKIPDTPHPSEPGVKPGKTKEPEIPQPAPAEPNEKDPARR